MKTRSLLSQANLMDEWQEILTKQNPEMIEILGHSYSSGYAFRMIDEERFKHSMFMWMSCNFDGIEYKDLTENEKKQYQTQEGEKMFLKLTEPKW